MKISVDEIWDLSCSPAPLSHLSRPGHACPCYSFISASIIPAAIWNRTFVASIALRSSDACMLRMVALMMRNDSVRWDVTQLDWELGDTAKGQE